MAPKRSRSAIIAEGFEVLAAELDGQRQLLEDIKRILLDLADGQNVLSERVRDTADRQGTRLHNVERRVGALELVTGGRSSGGE